ncbi:MAG: ribose 5-phosphate isomerase A, partial [Anaerolineae bacterium]|nr:ribose 5-phosphate isomerase A [Anaerolineae bacterium]
MAENEKELEEFKRQAAEAAVDLVRSGMVVGLGHGSTAIFAVKKLAIKLNTGELERIIGIPCSHMIKDA